MTFAQIRSRLDAVLAAAARDADRRRDDPDWSLRRDAKGDAELFASAAHTVDALMGVLHAAADVTAYAEPPDDSLQRLRAALARCNVDPQQRRGTAVRGLSLLTFPPDRLPALSRRPPFTQQAVWEALTW